MKAMDLYMLKALSKRKDEGCLRQLRVPNGLIDFCSNDYFGWSRSLANRAFVDCLQCDGSFIIGSTGSRLISGNSLLAEEVEGQIARFHQAESALLLNTGYLANLGLISALAKRGDFIVRDECVHASAVDGCRLSLATTLHFKHNQITDLRRKLEKYRSGKCFVLVESLYSMNGDFAPLSDLIDVCDRYNALLIVDEAHAIGVFGGGLIQLLGLEKRVFARVVTFGKALGVQGAAILGSKILQDYLINYCRPFIYSTAASYWQLLAVRLAYQRLARAECDQALLQAKCLLFNQALGREVRGPFLSPIQIIYGKSNQEVEQWSEILQHHGFDVSAIKSPTVKPGRECLRVCLHSYNKDEDIIRLVFRLKQLIKNE